MHWERMKVLARTRETAEAADKTVFCLHLETQTPYAPGDWLLVRPTNPQAVVDELMAWLSLSPDAPLTLKRVGETTVGEALRQHLEITRLEPAVLNRLQRQAGIGDWPDRQAMAAWAQGRSLFDLLCAFPEARALGPALLPLLSPLGPRFYSIASSARAEPGEVHLLFRQVLHETCRGVHPGAATWLLSQVAEGGTVEARIQSNPHFHLPDDTVPVVMIGAGVGLAPFMGFVAERVARDARGENWLFFGERHPETTFLCRSRLARWVQAGRLHLVTAFSRVATGPRYVQDALRASADTVRRLAEEGAVFYVCGDRLHMAPAVRTALTEILRMPVDVLQQQGRLRLDVF